MRRLLVYSLIVTTLMPMMVLGELTARADALTTRVAAADDDDQTVLRRRAKQNCASVDTDSLYDYAASDQPTGNAAGGWSVDGSPENVNFNRVFELLTDTYGFSGVGAIGVLSNIASESGFDHLSVEGSFGLMTNPNKVRLDPNSKTLPSGYGPGAGLYQFTPASKYTNAPEWAQYSGWSVEGETAFMVRSEWMNRAVENYFVMNRAPVSTIEQYMTASDVTVTSKAFQVGYERPATYHPEREDVARAMAAKLGPSKTSIRADLSKLNTRDADGVSDMTGLTATDLTGDSQTLDAECLEQYADPDALMLDDFTGDHGRTLSGWGEFYKADGLPSDLTPYALAPETLGFTNGSCDHWTERTGQCVAWTKAFTFAAWTKGGNAPPYFACNGGQCARVAAAAMGGQVSQTPSAGAIGSMTSTSVYGHTFIVNHVFANGDILITETNIGGYSGHNNGETCTWSYRLVSKSFLDSHSATFFSPASVGYSLDSRYNKAPASAAHVSGKQGAIYKEALKHNGQPYCLSAAGPSTFDCSGLVYYGAAKNGVSIPRTAHAQYEVVKNARRLKTSISELSAGDLMFFDWDHNGQIDHVAFYEGGNRMYHASGGACQGRVQHNDITDYYRKGFVGGGAIA